MRDAEPAREVMPREWLAVGGATVIASAIFFYRQIVNGFSVFYNVLYDGRFEIGILQHWNNVLHGHEAWRTVGYFYPYENTLGFSDGYLLYGIVYSAFRSIGIDTYLSAELVHMTVKAVGVPAMYLLLRTMCRVRPGWSLLGAILFTIFNSSLMQGGHAQLFTIAFAPVAANLFWRTWTSLRDGRPTGVLRYGVASVVFYCAWLMTAYYMAWYFGLFCGLLCVVALLWSSRETKRAVLASAIICRKELGLMLVTFVLAVTPFLMTYLPTASETGMHLWMNAQQYALDWVDLVNVGPKNLFWGAFFTWLHGTFSPASLSDGEFSVGFPLFLLLVAVAGCVKAVRDRIASPLFFLVAVVVMTTWAMVYTYGDVRPWRIFFELVPGGRGTRVVARYQIFLCFPLTLLVARLLDDARRIQRPVIASLIAIVLIAEHFNAGGPISLVRQDELRMLDGVPPIPAECKSFYVVSARSTPYRTGHDDKLNAHNVDAMVIAGERGVPTINGYASFNPPDWISWDSAAANYTIRMRLYATWHDLHGVCSLDTLHGQGWQLVIR